MKKFLFFYVLLLLFSCRKQQTEVVAPTLDSDRFKIIYQILPIGSVQAIQVQFRDTNGELLSSDEVSLNLELYQSSYSDSELYIRGTLMEKGSSVFLIHRVFKNGTEIYSKSNTYSMNNTGQQDFEWSSQFTSD